MPYIVVWVGINHSLKLKINIMKTLNILKTLSYNNTEIRIVEDGTVILVFKGEEGKVESGEGVKDMEILKGGSQGVDFVTRTLTLVETNFKDCVEDDTIEQSEYNKELFESVDGMFFGNHKAFPKMRI